MYIYYIYDVCPLCPRGAYSYHEGKYFPQTTLYESFSSPILYFSGKFLMMAYQINVLIKQLQLVNLKTVKFLCFGLRLMQIMLGLQEVLPSADIKLGAHKLTTEAALDRY